MENTINSNKRAYKRYPGLKADAKKLGVSYGHLRLVLTGKRGGWALWSKYLDLKTKQSPRKLKQAPM